jgi:hypothetical protein
LLLAGERDRAAAYVEEADRVHMNGRVRQHWERVSRDIDALCAELHAREAAMVKLLKLDHVWEPSPFPVELPGAERVSGLAEHMFTPRPWVAVSPSPLQHPPTEPGEVRFAKKFSRRDGGIALVAPLTPQEAAERDRKSESCTLTARLPDGFFIMIARFSLFDRNEPNSRAYSTSPFEPSFHIELHGSAEIATVSTRSPLKGSRSFDVMSVAVHERRTYESLWHCNIDLEKGEKRIFDLDQPSIKSVLSSAERELATCSIPAFGEYAALDEWLRSLLRVTGYGAIT